MLSCLFCVAVKWKCLEFRPLFRTATVSSHRGNVTSPEYLGCMWHHWCKIQEFEEEDQRGRQREHFPAADRLSEVGSGGVARSRHRTPKTIFHPRHLLPSASVSPSCRLISGCVDSVICGVCVYTCCDHRQQRLLSPRPSIRCWSLHRCVSASAACLHPTEPEVVVSESSPSLWVSHL